MKTKSQTLIDYNWKSLSDRIEGVLELLQWEYDIVGMISAHREYNFYATIFYQKKEPVIDWSQCCICRPELDKPDHYCAQHVPVGAPIPGGCVSVPNGPAIEGRAIPVISSITPSESERSQEELEPLPEEEYTPKNPGWFHVG